MSARRVAAAALLLAGLGPAAAAPPPPAPFDVPAELLALRDVRVPAEVAGRVVRRPEDETKSVAKDEVVVALDDVFLAALARAARANADRAQARRDWAQLEFERVGTLLEKGSVNQAEFDQAQLTLREAAASLVAAEATADEAQRRLERAQIRAPFAGKLVRVYPETGEYLQVGATAFRIVDDTGLRVVAYVSAEIVARLEPGQEVSVRAERADEQLPPFTAKIFSIGPAAEGAARTFRVEARAPRPPGRWRPGMTARLAPAAASPSGAEDR